MPAVAAVDTRPARRFLSSGVSREEAEAIVETLYLDADERRASRQPRGLSGGNPHRCGSCRLFTGAYTPVRCQHCGYDPVRGFAYA